MSDAPAGLRHIVITKFKPHITSDEITKLTTAFRALSDTIPGITAFEYGVNNSSEGLDQGFTHVYQLTFATPADRDAYLPHPDHAAFGALLQQFDALAEIFVVDYVPLP